MTELTGRELDAEVARVVFEYEVVYRGGQHIAIDSRGIPAFVKDYSTDMGAAWQVAEKIREKTGHFLLSHGMDDEESEWAWECLTYIPHIEGGFIEISGGGDTAPEAICRAALKLAREETDD